MFILRKLAQGRCLLLHLSLAYGVSYICGLGGIHSMQQKQEVCSLWLKGRYFSWSVTQRTYTHVYFSPMGVLIPKR